jgi:preprotein translocase subunit SecG
MEDSWEGLWWGVAAVVAGGLIFAGIKWYHPLLSILHVFVCGVLILVVLMQSGRAADLAGAFGGAGSQTAFGPRGAATLLSKATTFLAIVFMLTSLSLAIFASTPTGGSLAEPATPAPAAPASAPPPSQ